MLGIALWLFILLWGSRWKFSLQILLMICVGWSVGSYVFGQLSATQPLMNHAVQIEAEAEADAVYGQSGQLDITVTNIRVIKPRAEPLVGKWHILGRGASMVFRGDRLRMSGVVRPSKGSRQAQMSFANIQIEQPNQSWLLSVRRQYIARLTSVLPEPEASFAIGLLLGQRSTIPEDINNQLAVAGLTHLVAVSGYNLTIMVVAARRLFGRASKYQFSVVSMLLIVCFVFLAGWSASLFRAALVSTLSLLAWNCGRHIKPLLLLALSGALTAMVNPFYIWSDLGWYLSFLAFFGVLIVAPILNGLLAPTKQPKMLASLLTETISAQLMTIPIILFAFGRFSVYALLANLLVVPLVPVAMLLALVSGLAACLSYSFGSIIAWPCAQLLRYMLEITAWVSSLPHASIQKQVSWQVMAGCYLLIGVGCLIAQLHRRPLENIDKSC